MLTWTPCPIEFGASIRFSSPFLGFPHLLFWARQSRAGRKIQNYVRHKRACHWHLRKRLEHKHGDDPMVTGHCGGQSFM